MFYQSTVLGGTVSTNLECLESHPAKDVKGLCVHRREDAVTLKVKAFALFTRLKRPLIAGFFVNGKHAPSFSIAAAVDVEQQVNSLEIGKFGVNLYEVIVGIKVEAVNVCTHHVLVAHLIESCNASI